MPLDDLFADADEFHLGGVTVRGLSANHRALHAAYHAIVGTPRPDLRSLRDLARHLARTDSDPELLVHVAEAWGGVAVLHQAAVAVLATLPIELPGWARWVSATVPDERDLRLIRQSWEDSSAPIDVALLRELPGLDRWRYLWAVAVPSRAVLAERGESQARRIRRGVRSFVASLGRGS